jgi:hypothetical protein
MDKLLAVLQADVDSVLSPRVIESLPRSDLDKIYRILRLAREKLDREQPEQSSEAD